MAFSARASVNITVPALASYDANSANDITIVFLNSSLSFRVPHDLFSINAGASITVLPSVSRDTVKNIDGTIAFLRSR